jgi:hypothetical protein
MIFDRVERFAPSVYHWHCSIRTMAYLNNLIDLLVTESQYRLCHFVSNQQIKLHQLVTVFNVQLSITITEWAVMRQY